MTIISAVTVFHSARCGADSLRAASRFDKKIARRLGAATEAGLGRGSPGGSNAVVRAASSSSAGTAAARRRSCHHGNGLIRLTGRSSRRVVADLHISRNSAINCPKYSTTITHFYISSGFVFKRQIIMIRYAEKIVTALHRTLK